MSEPPLEVVDFREPRRKQSQVERELCPHVRHVCEQYNHQADVFSKIVIPYTDDGPTGLGKVIEQKLLNKGMNFADVKGLTVQDLSEAKRAHTEHNKSERFRNPMFGKGYKFGLGYVPGAIERRGEAEKARQHAQHAQSHAQREAQEKLKADDALKAKLREIRETWAKVDPLEQAKLIAEAKERNPIGAATTAMHEYFDKMKGGTCQD